MPFIVVEFASLGSLREYLIQRKSVESPNRLRDVEILVRDVACALSALHTCGIVHGDIKLDNVLMFPSWDRPAKALAKLTDFGHALVPEGSKDKSHGPVRYGGTLM